MPSVVIGSLLLQPDVVVVLRHRTGAVADVACRLERRSPQTLAPHLEADHADAVAESLLNSDL